MTIDTVGWRKDLDALPGKFVPAGVLLELLRVYEDNILLVASIRGRRLDGTERKQAPCAS